MEHAHIARLKSRIAALEAENALHEERELELAKALIGKASPATLGTAIQKALKGAPRSRNLLADDRVGKTRGTVNELHDLTDKNRANREALLTGKRVTKGRVTMNTAASNPGGGA